MTAKVEHTSTRAVRAMESEVRQRHPFGSHQDVGQSPRVSSLVL